MVLYADILYLTLASICDEADQYFMVLYADILYVTLASICDEADDWRLIVPECHI